MREVLNQLLSSLDVAYVTGTHLAGPEAAAGDMECDRWRFS